MSEKKRLSVIMPSYQNEAMKAEAVQSLTVNTSVPFDFKFTDPNVNYGWMKGCNLGIEQSMDYDYCILSNDDILALPSNDWASELMVAMDCVPDVGAMTPMSMNVAGYAKLNGQNVTFKHPYEVPFATFYFVILRTEAIKKIGLLDESLPGGDDLDYCLRLRDAGYKIAVNPKVFMWHHYAQTGGRVYSDWDSEEHTFQINKALIRKHGFKKYIYGRTL